MEFKMKRRQYLESIGKRSCIMGFFPDGWEVWSWPVKLLSDLKTSVRIPKTMDNFPLVSFVDSVKIEPELVNISYVHPLFRMEEMLFTPIDFPGSFIVYDVETSAELELIFSFRPDLNLMWPGSIGGQYCHWSDSVNGFIISEPTDSFAAIVRAPGGTKHSKEGDHAFSESPYTFKVHLSAGHHRFPLSVVGGLMGKETCKTLLSIEDKLEQEMTKAKQYYEDYLANTLSIDTPDEELNEFFQWGKISLLKGFVKNPILGEGLIAGVGPSGKSTRPGFAWFFAGDASINSLALTQLGDWEDVRKTLEFYLSFQNEEGRIPHEISQSQGLIDWFNKYKGFAFLHADTTAWFLIACADYILQSGDTDFFERHSEKILKAISFYDKFCDETGLVLNYKTGLGALELSEFRKPKYEIYTSGLYLCALKMFQKVFEKLGLEERSRQLSEKIERVESSLEKLLWNGEKESYAFSMNTNGELFPYLTPWPCFPISLGIMDESKARRTVAKLLDSSVMTRWGARSIEVCEHYDPINYNLGSVWYFINGFVSKAFYRTDFEAQGFQIIKAAVKAFHEESTTHLSELFSGDIFAPVTTAVPHQLFSVGPIVWAITSGLLGLSFDAFENVLHFKPKLPVQWNRLIVDGLKVGKALLRIEFTRKGKQHVWSFKNLSSNPVKVFFEPKRPILGEIEGNGTFEFTLEGEHSVGYTLRGADFSFEYPNLSFGSSDDRILTYSETRREDGLELRFSNAHDARIYLLCTDDILVDAESHLSVSKVDEFLFVIETKSSKEVRLDLRRLKR